MIIFYLDQQHQQQKKTKFTKPKHKRRDGDIVGWA